MSEHEIPNNETDILRIALDIASHRDVLKSLLGQAHMELEASQANGLLEICRLDSLVWQTADECAALNCDLDDMQAEWAAENEAHYQEGERKIVQCQAALTTQRLRHGAEQETDRAKITEQAADLTAAYEYIKSLEEDARFHATPFSVELERKIAVAVAELRELASRESFNVYDILSIANRLHSGPRAPTVPRRAENGVEVQG